MYRLTLPLFAVLSAALLTGSQRASDPVIVRGECFQQLPDREAAPLGRGAYGLSLIHI